MDNEEMHDRIDRLLEQAKHQSERTDALAKRGKKVTLEELEALKQERLAKQEPRLQAARANADRADICIERFRAAGFKAARFKIWELNPSENLQNDADAEAAGEVFIETKKVSLAEAERLLAELAERDGNKS